MNSRNFTLFGIVALLVPLSIFLIIDIFSQGGNQLGNTFKWAMIGGGIIAFVSPRAGILAFLTLQFYADFLKRLMVLGDSMSLQDVMISLGLGPILVLVACVYCAIACLTGRIAFSRKQDIFFFIGCVTLSLLGGVQSIGEGVTEMGQSLLGTAMIGMTAYACYSLFRRETDSRLVMKCLVIGGIPMALYTLWQAAFGYAAWEERYILTGLSKVLYNFYVTGNGLSGMRPFSTLNTHTSVGAASGVLMLISWSILAQSKKMFPSVRSGKISYILIGLLYLAACVASQNRTTYFIPVFYYIIAWSFKSGTRTFALYGCAIAGAFAFIANSTYIDDNIIYWAVKFEGTSAGAGFGTLGTVQARLGGLIALTEKKSWAPFGIDENLIPFSHDLFSSSIMKYGYVPVSAVIFSLLLFLFWWHRSYLRIENPNQKLFLIRLTAMTLSLVICGLAYGNVLFVPPVNGLLGAILGVAMAVLRNEKVTGKNQAPAVATADDSELSPNRRLQSS